MSATKVRDPPRHPSLNIPLRFPQARPPGFNVPGVPLVPVLGILINVYLMLRLDALTLARFSVWMVVGESGSKRT